jgi:hypothetical protein
MKNKKIYFLGEKLGLDKNEINKTLKNKIFNCKNNSIFHVTDYYKDGTMYGVVSIKDL